MVANLLEILNLVAVMLIVLVFNSFLLYSLHATKKKSCHEALYERSHHLLILANLSNFIQSMLNILFGLIYFEYSFSSASFLFTYYSLATFFSRFYAILMGLRVFRTTSLHKLRHGKLKSKFHILLKLKFNLIIGFVYSSLLTGIYLLDYNYANSSTKYSEMKQIVCLIESTALFLLSYISFNKARHPTVALEYVFYSFIWLTGCLPRNENRSFLIIPIRNSLLLVVSSASLYTHNNLIRPSFPAMIQFSNLFEIKEVFDDFSLYVSKNGDSKEKEALKIYINMKVQQYCGNDKMAGNIIEQFNSCTELTSLINESILIDICIIEDCAEQVLRDISYSYLDSEEFRRMKREYFIKYN